MEDSARFNKIKATEKVMQLVFMSNSNSRQYLLAMYVDNKIAFRNHVLDMTTGCEESKKTLRTTFSSSLFGPFPESYHDRLESAYSSRNRQNLQSSYCLTFPVSPAASTSKRGPSSSSRETKWSRQEFPYPTPPESSSNSFPGSPRGRGNFQYRGRGKKRGWRYKSQ